MTTWWKRNLPMTQVRHWITAAVVAVGLCTLLLLAACTPGSSAPSSPMRGSLALDGRPALGEPFMLRLELRTSMAFTDVAVSFVLPTGAELLDTPGEWQIESMEADRTYVFTGTVRIVQNGYFRLCGGGVKHFSSESYFGGGDCIYVLVEGEDTWVSHDPPPNHWRSPQASVGVTPLQPELIQNRLYLSGTLTLNQPVTLVYEVTPLVDLQIATVGIAVPVGGLQSSEPRAEASDTTLITPLKFHSSTEGVYYWNGSMKGQQTYSFYITLEPTAGGESVVDASVNESGTVDSVTRPVIATSQSLTLTLYSPSLAR